MQAETPLAGRRNAERVDGDSRTGRNSPGDEQSQVTWKKNTLPCSHITAVHVMSAWLPRLSMLARSEVQPCSSIHDMQNRKHIACGSIQWQTFRQRSSGHTG